MNTHRLLTPVLLPLVLLLGQNAWAKVSVVATLPDLAAIASEVGGEHVFVTALAPASQDPHYVDPKPSLILPLNRADLLIVNGLDLEVGWLPPLVLNARNAKIQVGSEGYFDASQYVRRLQVPQGKVDRSMGDVHPGGNPHFTFDPRQVIVIAKALADRLGVLDPKNAKDYQNSAQAFSKQLSSWAAEERARFAKLPAARRRVVTYHKSMSYFLDWLGLEEIVTVEPKPGIAPNPQHVSNVLGLLRSQGVNIILQEEHHPQSTSKTLARLAGAKLVIVHSAVRFEDGERYIDHIKRASAEVYNAF